MIIIIIICIDDVHTDTEIEAADLIPPQYTDTRPTSLSTNPIMPGT